MFKAIKAGSEKGMIKYIDFASVHDSIKQQVETSIEQNKTGDPFTDSMLVAFRPMIDKMVDELVTPEKLAVFIKTGDLKEVRNQKSLATQNDTHKSLSWFAFFEGISRFRVSVDKLVLHMEFKNLQWKLVAIGSSDLLDLNKARAKKVKQHIADEIDKSPAPVPVAYSDLKSLKNDYVDSFFIGGDYGSKLTLEGDLFFLSGMKNSNPALIAFEGYDKDGKIVTRDFTKAEKEQKATYLNFFNGNWRENIYKTSPELEVQELKGRLQVNIPTGVDSFKLIPADKGKLYKKSKTAVTLTSISNGTVGLSFYSPFSEGKKEFIVICRNKNGQRLKTTGSFGTFSREPITLPADRAEYKARSKTINVSGTPHIIEVYYVYQDEKVEIDFMAYPKPEVSSGKLKSPIRRTRYVVSESEPEPRKVSRNDLNGITYQYKQELSYDGKERRFLHFILPKIANTYFAKVDYSGIKLSLNDKDVKFKVNKEHIGQANFKVYFGQPDKEWGESVKLDKIDGKVVFRYPSKIESKTIRQGERINGISLMKHNFTYSKESTVLPFHSVWPVVSARAYDAKKREIARLDSYSWGRTESNVMFWGNPAYVEYKVASEWLTIEFDVSKTEVDKVVVENN